MFNKRANLLVKRILIATILIYLTTYIIYTRQRG